MVLDIQCKVTVVAFHTKTQGLYVKEKKVIFIKYSAKWILQMKNELHVILVISFSSSFSFSSSCFLGMLSRCFIVPHALLQVKMIRCVPSTEVTDTQIFCLRKKEIMNEWMNEKRTKERKKERILTGEHWTEPTPYCYTSLSVKLSQSEFHIK